MTHGLNLQIAAEAGTTGPKWLDAFLPSNVSIDITLNSQIWNAKAGSFSETIALPIEENLHILGNLASMRGCDVYKLLYGRRFRLYAEGVLFFYGVIHLDQEVSIKDNTIEIELASSTLEWEDLIADLDCRDVPLKDRIVLGDAIENDVTFYLLAQPVFALYFRGNDGDAYPQPRYIYDTFLPYARSKSTLKLPEYMVTRPHVLAPYPQSEYTQINICYQKKDSDGNKLREYEMLPYDRPNSSPCFYVLYFLDCLFYHLKVSVLQNDLISIRDLRSLAFVNTGCFYEVDKNHRVYTHNKNVKDFVKVTGCTVDDSKKFFLGDGYTRYLCNVTSCKIEVDERQINFYEACATSKNFPDKDVKTVINSLLAGFGARLLYNSIDQTCRIVLLRDILRQTDYTEIPCKVNSVYKKQEHKEGFRLKYSASVEDKEVDMEDYNRDTMYNYTEYDDISQTAFKSIYKTPKLYDNRCYIDPHTGNAYRVKVDKDAKKKNELYPSWLEVGQFCAAEYGNCSDEENIEIISVDFTPVVMNVMTNYNEYERFAYMVDIDNIGDSIDAQEDVTFDILYRNHTPGQDSPRTYVKIWDYEWEASVSLSYQESSAYDPSRSLQNPLNEIDNGLQLGIGRADIPSVEPEEDDEGNTSYPNEFTKYDNIFHSDSVDSFGNVFDYNDDQSGIDGDDERISLKLRAEKPDVENGGFLPISDPLNQRRGIFSRFYTEYAKWVTERNLAVIEAEVELAWLMNIDMTKKYKIGEFVGFLKSVKYSISNTGLSMVTFELYYL